MKHLLLLILAVAITLVTACKTVKTQGIQGTVQWISGNQMPGPGTNKKSPAQGIAREVRIYPATFIHQVQSKDGSFYTDAIGKPVMVIQSSSDGTFTATLPPGKYSIFTKEVRGLFANQYDGEGCINCVEVRANEFTDMTIKVDYEAAY